MNAVSDVTDGDLNGHVILCHGGLLEDHATFWPFSHFGSEQAAIDRIRQNLTDQLPTESIRSTLYICQVDLGKNIVDLPEWHAALPSGIILALWKEGLLPISITERGRVMADINTVQRSDPRKARNLVFDAIRHLEISTLRYPNLHEGEYGEYSYCIVDPSSVRVVEYRNIDVLG